MSKSELEEIIINSIRKLSGSPLLSVVKDDVVMNQKQAAEFLGISQSTLIAWKKKNLVPYEQLPGSSKVRYYKSQLKQVCQQNSGLLQAARK